MSFYRNSEGIERQAWGLDSETNGKVIGYEQPKVDAPKTVFQRMFGKRNRTENLQKLVKKGRAQTRKANEGRVPQFKFGARTEFSKNGFVQPNTGNTKQTRVSVFEQNFIKRIYVMYRNVKDEDDDDSLRQYSAYYLKEGSAGDAEFWTTDITILLKRYLTRLNTETDETSAIMLYNELIIFYILICVDLMESSWRLPSGLHREILRLIKKAEAKDISKGLLAAKILRIFLDVGACAAVATVLLSPVGLGLAAGGVIGYVITTVVSYVATGLVDRIGDSAEHALESKQNIWGDKVFGRVSAPMYQEHVDPLIGAFCFLNGILFSNKNPIQITTVKDKLKYWGLLQNQVDYMFEFGLAPDSDLESIRDDLAQRGQPALRRFPLLNNFLLKMINYYRNDTHTTRFAPNEPFSKEIISTAYPKSPLAGNPFADASAFSERNPFRNVSKLEVPAHIGPLRSMIGGISRRRGKRKISKRKLKAKK